MNHRYGIKRVVVATEDPDPRVSGKGLKFLKECGLDVLLGVHERESRKLNAPFIYRVKNNKPYVISWVCTSQVKHNVRVNTMIQSDSLLATSFDIFPEADTILLSAQQFIYWFDRIHENIPYHVDINVIISFDEWTTTNVSFCLRDFVQKRPVSTSIECYSPMR